MAGGDFFWGEFLAILSCRFLGTGQFDRDEFGFGERTVLVGVSLFELGFLELRWFGKTKGRDRETDDESEEFFR